MRFTVTNASGTEVGSCTTLAVGTCTVSVANGHTYTVTQAAAPGGWFTSHDLGVGTAANLAAANYSRVSVQVPSGGGTISVPPTGTSSNTNNAYRSGVWALSRDNPPAPAACGLNVALLFDLSGSIAPNLARYKAAAEGFITALRGTPSAVALYTFASNARANFTNNANYPLTPVTTAPDAAPLITRIRGFTATGGTNWDRGIWQAAASVQHYDIAVMLTDGDPTYYGTGPSGPGNRTRFAEVENGIFSANALKLKATRILGVGVGVLERRQGSVDNLKAISGPTEGSDYFVTNFAALDVLLKQLALHNCAGIRIEKSAAPRRYDHAGQEITYTYTVTNTGTHFTLHDILVSDNRVHGQVHCDATILVPGAHTTCTATYAVTQPDMDDGHVTNVAVATGTTTNGDVVPSDPATQTVRAIQRPAVSIVKTASVDSFDTAGLEITYFYHVTNTGNVTLVNTNATDSRGLPLYCERRYCPPGLDDLPVVLRHHPGERGRRHIDNVGLADGDAPERRGGARHRHARHPQGTTPRGRASSRPRAWTASAAAGTPVTYYYLVTNKGHHPQPGDGHRQPGHSGQLPARLARHRWGDDLHRALRHHPGRRGPGHAR